MKTNFFFFFPLLLFPLWFCVQVSLASKIQVSSTPSPTSLTSPTGPPSPPLKLISSTYKILEGEIFSVPTQLAVFTLDFNQELYFLDSVVDCQYAFDPSCADEPTNSPKTCDDSMQLIAPTSLPMTWYEYGKAKAPKATKAPTSPRLNKRKQSLELPTTSREAKCQFSTCNYANPNKTLCGLDCLGCLDRAGNCELNDTYYRTQNVVVNSTMGNWIELQEGKPFTFNSNTMQYDPPISHVMEKNFRFYLPNTCFPVVVKVKTLQGRQKFEIGRRHRQWRIKPTSCSNVYSKWQGGGSAVQQVTLCPSDAYFGVGTYYVTVFESLNINNNLPSIYEISWSYQKNTAYRKTSALLPPPVASPCVSDAICLQDGQEVFLGVGKCTNGCIFEHYLSEFACPQLFSASIKGPLHSSHSFFLSTNLENLQPSSDNHDLYLKFVGSRKFSWSLCPINPEGSLFFTLFTSSEVWVTVSSNRRLFTSMPISSLTVSEVQSFLQGSSILDCSTPDAKLSFCDSPSCEGRNQALRIVPGDSFHSLWPLNPMIKNKRLSFPNNHRPYPSKKWSIELLLQQNFTSGTETLFGEKQLQQCRINFLWGLVDKRQISINATQKIVKKQPKCTVQGFHQLKTRYANISTRFKTPPLPISQTIFEIEQLGFSDYWVACNQLVGRFLHPKVKNITTSQGCMEPPGTPEFDSNPCCNPILQWTSSCRKSQRMVEALGYEINKQQLCGVKTCAELYLNDIVWEREKETYGGCQKVQSLQEKFFSQSSFFFRKCLSLVTGDPSPMVKLRNSNKNFTQAPFTPTLWQYTDWSGYSCFTNADCPNQVHCNSLHQMCEIPSTDLNRAFLNCYIQNAPQFVLRHLKDTFNLPQNHHSEEFFILLMENMKENTCITPIGMCNQFEIFGAKDGAEGCSYFKYVSPAQSAHSVECSQYETLAPESFHFTPEACKRTGLYPLQQLPNQRKCETKTLPVWIPDPTRNEEVLSFCNLADSKHYQYGGIQLVGPTSKENCEVIDICLSPSGRFTRKGKKNCVDTSECTQPCSQDNYSCQSAYFMNGICFGYINAGLCVDSPDEGLFDSENEVCLFHSLDTKEKCLSKGLNWESCSDFSDSQSCQNTSKLETSQYLKCIWTRMKKCADRDECESFSGVCDDSYLFLPHGLTRGGCVVPLAPFQTAPCQHVMPLDNVLTTKYGCLMLNISREADCSISGANWINMTYSQQECLAKKACVEPSYSYLTQLDRFVGSEIITQKNQTECALSEGKFAPLFAWIPGKWVNSKFLKPVWQKQQYKSGFFEWGSSFEIPKLYRETQKAIQNYFSYQIESVAECKFNRPLLSMEPLICDCSGKKGAQCYTHPSPVSIAVQQVCQGDHVEILADRNKITIPHNSLSPQGTCTKFHIFFSTSEYYKNQPPKKSFGTFTSTPAKKPPSYSDHYNNAVLAGDGVSIFVDAIGNQTFRYMDICLHVRDLGSQSPSFPVQDFVVAEPGKKTFYPLHLNITCSNDRFCASIPLEKLSKLLIYSSSGSQWNRVSLFPAYRRDSPVGGEKLTSSELAVACIMAILYVAVFIFFIALPIYTGGFSTKHFFTLMFRCFITLVMLTRFIYFVAVSAGAFPRSSYHSGEQILSHLPSFFFFTALTAIFASLVLITSKELVNAQDKKRLRIVFIAVNTIMYLLFLVFVLGCILLPNDQPVQEGCGGRLPTEEGEWTSHKTLSMAFRLLIVLLAVIILVAIIIVGAVHSLNPPQNQTQSPLAIPTGNGNDQEETKMKLLVFVFGASFMLQGTLLLILTGLANNEGIEDIGMYAALFLIGVEIIPVSIVYFMRSGPVPTAKALGMKRVKL